MSFQANSPLVYVIVVTYNSKRFWDRQRVALAAQTYDNWKLIIVDNASRAEERLESSSLPSGATLIQSEQNLGFAAANNQAARNVDATFIALLNPDAFPEPDWLTELVRAAERWPNAAAIGGLQVRADNPSVYDGEGDEMHALGLPYRTSFGKQRTAPAAEGETFGPCGAAALYRLADWRACEGFDESFFCYCEDIDLAYRLRLRGRVSVQTPRAIVHHVGGGSTTQISGFAEFHGQRNRFWTFVKNTPPLLFWPLLPAHLFVTLLQALAALANGDARLRGAMAGLGSSSIWRTRAELQKTRTASTWSIAKALAWSPTLLLTRRCKRANNEAA